MSLLRAERRRLFKRRFTRLMLTLVVAILAIIAVSFTINSHQNGPAARAAAQDRATAAYEEQKRFYEQFVTECEAAKASGNANPDRFPPDCGKGTGPQPEMFPADWFMPYEFNFRKEFGYLIMVFAGLLALLAYVVGASFVGAEWNSGGMMNLLLWRPRRVPVLLAKLGTLLGGVLAIGVVLGALWTVAFWFIGKYDGNITRMTPGAWRSFAIDGARGVGLALAFAAIGFGLASLGRHTAMALGAAVGAVVVGEIGVRIALELMRVRMYERFVPSTYIFAWFNKKWTLYDYRACEFARGECQPKQLVITWQQSALVMGITLAAVLALAIWAMRRRDVT
ncbi:MAG TPA: ABC transporter permease subunit [Micromonosporaceae bacterium]|nr:ABC transporter permease subunit [Micromonosporaceae bacterium]